MRLTPETIKTGIHVTIKGGNSVGVVIGLNRNRTIAETVWPNGNTVHLDTKSLYRSLPHYVSDINRKP